jgi:hypothetical protein
MKKHQFKILVPGIFAAVALALAVGAGAQTTPAPAAPPAAKSPQAAPATGHHKVSAATAKHDVDLKAECEAMMAKKQAMQDKLQADDAALDKLVVVMNAAKPEVDMEKAMAAVINELVAQRKACRAMMMEMQPEMMAHMLHHMHAHGTQGAMECPMVKTGKAPEPKAAEKPKM